MAMTTCSECKGRMSDRAPMCPHCGFGLEQAFEKLQRRLAAPGFFPAGSEKRRQRRIEIKTMVRVDGEVALLFNISRSGMMLSTPVYPKGPAVDVTLETGEKVFELKGVIRWVSGKRSFSNLVDFGLEITAAPAGYNELIDRLESC